MKNKLIIVAVLVTLVTISFSFTVVNKQSKAKVSKESSQSEPMGGFVSEGKF